MKFILTTLVLLLVTSAQTRAQPSDEDLSRLQHTWAKANYQLTEKYQVQAFETLLTEAESVVSQHPGDANYLIWHAIIQSTYAGVKGGLGALKLAKAARKNLDKALEIDETALQGSAFTSLGSLYANVPGWPVGFGSDKKAAKMLKKGLEINPGGLEPNYFYADYLMQNKNYEQAQRYFLKAQQAPTLEGRPVADAGRRKLIDEALVLVQAKLN